LIDYISAIEDFIATPIEGSGATIPSRAIVVTFDGGLTDKPWTRIGQVLDVPVATGPAPIDPDTSNRYFVPR
jgi:hypothetical protein